MSTYFVDAVNGNDASNGLGPDASAVTNKPWKTLAKLLGASGMASGDTAYLSPAGPFREVVSVAMTSATVETKVIGDVANAQGFKTALGAAIAPGPIIWTPYATDTGAPGGSGNATLTLAGRDFLTFDSIIFVASTRQTGGCVDGLTTTSTNITLRKCQFLATGNAVIPIYAVTVYGTALHWLIDRCGVIAGSVQCIEIDLPQGAGADYDADVIVRNSLLLSAGGAAVTVKGTGAAAGAGGGVLVYRCTCFAGGNAVPISNANTSGVFPCLVWGTLFASRTTTLSALAPGQIVEDANLILTNTPRANVSIGPYTQVGQQYAPLLGLSLETLVGQGTRPFLMPLASSPVSGFGSAILVVGNTPTVADDATVGTISWTNPTNASLPEGTNLAVASTIPITTGISHYLKATAHAGLAGIPSNATIKSVRVELGVKASAATAIACSSVKLVKAGVIAGNDLSASNTVQFSTTLAAQSWGNTSDPLWGLALTPSDVQASNFGCVWAAKNTSGSTADCSVDFVRVIVAYTTADGHGGVATDLLGTTRPIPEAVGALEYSAPAASGGVSRARVTNMGGI